MKRIVLVFGVIAGVIMIGAILIQMLTLGEASFTYGELIGYSTMLLAFLLIFFGIRSYRDQNGGSITLGKALQVGLLITLVACSVYVAVWEVYYYSSDFGHSFVKRYNAHYLEKERQRGVSEAQLAAEKAKMDKMAVDYEKPLVNIGMTFMEPFPVGLILTIVSAAILRRKTPQSA